jgi:hypothetical protein
MSVAQDSRDWQSAAVAPASLAGLVGGALSTWLRNLRLLVGIAAVAWLPFQALQLTLAIALGIPHSSPVVGGIYAAIAVLGYVAVLALTQGALTQAVAARLAGGHSSIVAAYEAAAARYLSLLSAFLCLCLLLGAVFAATVASAFALRGLLPPRYLLVLLVMAYVLPLFVAPRFTVITQAVILDAAGGITAVRRSWTLLRGQYWTSLALLVVLGVLGFAVTSLVSIPARMVAANGDLVLLVMQSLGAAVATVLVAGLIPCAYTLLYFHARRAAGGTVA